MASAYAQAFAARKSLREQALSQLRNVDAAIMARQTNLMHFLGLPSLALRLCIEPGNGMPRGLILYAADERRLYCAAPAIERLCQLSPAPLARTRCSDPIHAKKQAQRRISLCLLFLLLKAFNAARAWS